MSKTGGLAIGVVGLGFGSAFVPIYQRHPNVGRVGICETNPEMLAAAGDRFGIDDRFSCLDDMLADGGFDAIHLLTPVPLHAEQTLRVLRAGKHCACAVPAATSIEDLEAIIAEEEQSGKVYMMMETGIYCREFLYVKDLLDRGELGNLTFLRGTYYQDLEADYPKYWWAQPPMHYATHALSPLLALTGKRVSKVVCMGSGRLHSHIQQSGGNVFPLQTALFQLENSDVVAEVTRSWFQMARSYTEGFSVYGDQKGFEWAQLEDREEPVLFTMEPPRHDIRWRNATSERVVVPYRPDLLPEALQEFADGGHGGSHPHLVHEFVTSIVEGRKSRIDARTAANWTVAGICADLSARQDGEPIYPPEY